MSNLFAGIRWVWMNGELIEFEKATVHVLSHGLHYGSGVFEGVRCYDTPDGPAVFRLPEHIRRLENSCKIYRMPLRFSSEELAEAVCETVRANDLGACYIRPIAYRGFGTLGVNPLRSPVDVAIGAWNWGKYLGEQGEQEGIDVCVSSWRRTAPDALPAVAKATGSYLNSQLIKVEALSNGFAEGIALDDSGYVSEGSGENLFLVHNGTLVTPPTTSSLLPGITRDTIITLAHDLGLPVRQEPVSRGQLYICDELFLTGTAAEITPVRSVDKINIGAGRPGEITRRLLAEFRNVTGGRVPGRLGWLAPIARKPVEQAV
ncbi:MAG TPA: branched-chain amino acid transaminase [Thermoanaerobaculia bacterium]|nr:branched-chain amino acid transaminase [Thermoanaerobaculia bacterium]